MELRHLRYFIAVALEENVSKAALKLHVSQPALSRQVKDLEEELGFPLLERSAKSVSLTEAGRVFLDEASTVLERLEEGIATARATFESRNIEINVGYAPSLSTRVLPTILRAFQSKHSSVRVRLHDLTSEDMLAGLTNGDLQFALMVKPVRGKLRGLRFFTLHEERIVLATSPSHPLASKAVVKASDLRDGDLSVFRKSEYPDYHDMLGRVFGESRRVPKPAEEFDGVTSLITSIEIGQHVAIVTDSISCVSGSRLKLVPISPEPEPLKISIAWLTGELNEIEEAFLEISKTSSIEPLA